MPDDGKVIVIANSKGGAGKSTAAILSAGELAIRGLPVTLIDADPNTPAVRWSKKGCPPTLKVIGDEADPRGAVNEDNIQDLIASAKATSQYVIVDLEGVASKLVSDAIECADLVLVPLQGSDMDAHEATKVINLTMELGKTIGRLIPYSVFLTRTSAAIQPRTLTNIVKFVIKHGIPMLDEQLHERDAFKAIMSFGGTVGELDPGKVSKVDKAALNARRFVRSIIETLQDDVPQAQPVQHHAEMETA